ncbi:MAG: type II toxin-antitoxin system VapC family toxin [Beijerinckiaceae bacterium]
MRLYLDTNVVVAMIVAEDSSRAVRETIRNQGAALVSSDLVRLKVVATLARKSREKLLTDEEAMRAVMSADRFLHAETDCMRLEVRDFELARAMLIANFRNGLRSPDALHMSLAQRAGATLFTNDKKLLASAPLFGLATVKS